MHLVIQNQLPDTRLQPLLEASGFEEPSREFTGAAQNLHRGIGGTQTLYGTFQMKSQCPGSHTR
jgi:hypothetical protein